MKTHTPTRTLKPWKRIAIWSIIVADILLILLAGYFFFFTNTAKVDTARTMEPFLADEDMDQIVTSDYPLLSPVKIVDIRQESRTMQALKGRLQVMIAGKEADGSISGCGIFLKRLDDGEWIGINQDMRFGRNSMLKIAMLLCYLKESEKDPGILDKRYAYTEAGSVVPDQYFASKSIIPGKEYTVKELLEHMIIDSDNYANALLGRFCKPQLFVKVFTDLGIPAPVPGDPSFSISPRAVSRFMRVLYDATYLTAQNSQYALELLTRSTFHQGLTKDIPSGVVVAHKFGEYQDREKREFSETGLFYGKKQDYLITVMVSGADIPTLAGFASEVSGLVYRELEGQ